jgi:hypothetical protein
VHAYLNWGLIDIAPSSFRIRIIWLASHIFMNKPVFAKSYHESGLIFLLTIRFIYNYATIVPYGFSFCQSADQL